MYCMKRRSRHTRRHKRKTVKQRQRQRQRQGQRSMNKTFKKLNCSPENKTNSYTCYSDADLSQLKRIWNSRHPDRPIVSNNSKDIWEQLKSYYASKCNKETCWVRQMVKNTKMEKELLDAFAPESPANWKKNPNEWLSSLDILDVMSQYEKKYKCFDFLGPSPIDYDTRKSKGGSCVWDELCKFSLANHLKRGYRKIGIIFNLDPHYKGGSHWVSLFINVKTKTIFYFDSAGEAVPDQIKKFVDTVIAQGTKLNPPVYFKFDQNHPVEHQYGNTECGIYSIFFITHMLEDKITAHYLKTHILKDEYMQKFRKVYFNEHGSL